MLDLVRVGAESDGHDPFPKPVLLKLRQLIPCDVVSYGEFDPKRSGWRSPTRWVGEPRALLTQQIGDAVGALQDQHPHAPTDPAPLLRWSDRISRRELLRLEFYSEVMRPLGCEYQLTLWVRDQHTILGGFAFDRFRRDFSDRDLQVLQLLHPHLVQFAKQAAQRLPDAIAALTPRQREILSWAARGRTNAEIGKILWLSPATVRKHLDNIYDKLDVPNRTAAVSRGYGISLPAGHAGESASAQ
jgi:DNA-binding CsgD family transcriptional regulator